MSKTPARRLPTGFADSRNDFADASAAPSTWPGPLRGCPVWASGFLALGGMVDLTSPAGKMTTGVINAAEQFERDLLIERTQSGLKRAKAEGAVLGRPATLDERQRKAVRGELERGASVTVMRVRDGAAPAV
jgi:hypothetical protein